MFFIYLKKTNKKKNSCTNKYKSDFIKYYALIFLVGEASFKIKQKLFVYGHYINMKKDIVQMLSLINQTQIWIYVHNIDPCSKSKDLLSNIFRLQSVVNSAFVDHFFRTVMI